MKKISFINIILFGLFFCVSMPCSAGMDVLEDEAMNNITAGEGISNISIPIPRIEIEMEPYQKDNTNITVSNNSNTMNMFLNGMDQTNIIKNDLNLLSSQMPFGANEAGLLYSPNSYATQIISNLSIGSIPGLTMLYGGFMPGTMLGPNLIRNLSIGLTPAGTSFGSIMTQAFSQCFTHSITGVSSTMNQISGHTISGHINTRSYSP